MVPQLFLIVAPMNTSDQHGMLCPSCMVLFLSGLMLFVIPYFFLTQYTIHQFYISGFVFLLPLGIMTVMYKRISVYGLYWKAVALSVLGTIFTFLIFWNYDATASITNSDLYERIICSGRIPQNLTDNIFPNRIPLDATEIELSYSPKMLGQSGLQFALSFSAPESVIEDYVREFYRMRLGRGLPWMQYPYKLEFSAIFTFWISRSPGFQMTIRFMSTAVQNKRVQRKNKFKKISSPQRKWHKKYMV